MKEIRVGLIGCGFMGKTHIYGYKTIPVYYEPDFKIKLVSVCNRSIEKAQHAKELYGFDFATTREDDLFNNKDIDVIDICTPNEYHKDQIIKALNAKKHIYCEKPVVANPAHAAEVLKHPNLEKVTTQAVFHNRFFANVLRAKQIIEEGRLGKILTFRGQFLLPSYAKSTTPASWRHTKEESGGGVLYDVGSHISDMVYYMLGDFAKVYGKTHMPYKTRPDGKGGVFNCQLDEAAYIIATLKNGAVGTIEASKLASGAATDMKLEINGEKGALIINFMEPNWLYFYDNTLPDEKLGGYKGYTRIECIQNYDTPVMFPPGKHPIGWIRAHVHSLYTFLQNVQAGKQSAPSIKDGLYVQHVLDSVYKSAELNREVDI